MDTSDTFGAQLLAARLANDLTQEELAERSGLSVRAIRDMERGRVRLPQRRTLAILATALHLSGQRLAAFLAVAGAARRRSRAASPDAAPSGSAQPGDPPPGGQAGPTGVRVPGELPAPPGDFTGRGRQLAVLTALGAAAADGDRTAPAVAAVVGPPGMGKTSLAVYAGHRLRERFPGGQLFADLRGNLPEPLDVADALAGFLRSLGVDDRRMPTSVAERAGLYRTLVGDLRLLVLLDNAASEAQVRPLLPAGRHSLVLITSRRPLAGLEAVDRLSLDVLGDDEAMALLSSVIGQTRVTAEPAAAREVAALCGRLPLALRIAGNRLASRPGWSLRQLVGQLRDQRLTALTAGDLAVRAAFAMSYGQLTAAAAVAFRRACLIPGPDFDESLVAVVAGMDGSATARAVEELVDAGLVQPTGDGDRYGFHDLLRLYAGERLDADDPPTERGEARERLVTWLLRRTSEAAASFAPATERSAGRGGLVDAARSARPGRPETVPAGGDAVPAGGDAVPAGRDAVPAGAAAEAVAGGDDRHDRARVWLDREAVNWVAALRQAAAAGRHPEVVAVARSLHWYSDTTSHRHPWDEVYGLGVESARAAGDLPAEAALLNFLGWALYFCRDRVEEGLIVHRRAIRLARQLGDRREEAWGLTFSAAIAVRTGHPRRALTPSRRALGLFRGIGYGLGEHTAMGVLGTAQAALGHYTEALDLHRQMLAYHRGDSELSPTGKLVAQAATTMLVGHDLGHLGRWPEAARTYVQAGRLFRRAGGQYGEAEAAYRHGLALAQLGATGPARAELERAVGLFGAANSAVGLGRARTALANLTPSDVRRGRAGPAARVVHLRAVGGGDERGDRRFALGGG